MIVKDAAYAITDDSRTFYKCAKQLVENGAAAFRPIKLDDGFDPAFFNGGQRELTLEDDDEAVE